MKALFLLTLPMALMAQEAPPPSITAPSPANHSTISIEAKARADDLVKAFDLLKREKPTLKIAAHTFSNQVITNIIEISMMPNGTMLLFRLSSAQGIKNQFVAVDDVIDLFYL